jgi:hypothetical protein
MGFLMGNKITLESKLHTAFTFNRLSTELLVISQINLNIKSLTTFSAAVHLLALRMFPAEVPSKLIQTHKSSPANGTSAGDLLIMPRPAITRGVAIQKLFSEPFLSGIVRVVSLVVHFQCLWILESLVAATVGTLKGPSVLDQIDRHSRDLSILSILLVPAQLGTPPSFLLCRLLIVVVVVVVLLLCGWLKPRFRLVIQKPIIGGEACVLEPVMRRMQKVEIIIQVLLGYDVLERGNQVGMHRGRVKGPRSSRESAMGMAMAEPFERRSRMVVLQNPLHRIRRIKNAHFIRRHCDRPIVDRRNGHQRRRHWHGNERFQCHITLPSLFFGGLFLFFGPPAFRSLFFIYFGDFQAARCSEAHDS